MTTILRYLLYAVAFTPLISIHGDLPGIWNATLAPFWLVYFPNITGKAVFAHVLIDIAIICYVFVAWRNPELRPRSSFLLYVLVGYIGVMLVSAVFGVSLNRSLWGTFQRATGVIDMVHWTAYAVMVGGLLNVATRSQAKKNSVVSTRHFHGIGGSDNHSNSINNFISLNIVIACIVALIALWQWIQEPGRVGSTLDNPIYLGGYSMVMALFAMKLEQRDKRWYLAVVLLTTAVFLSGSRSSVLALVVALGTLGVWYVAKNRFRVGVNIHKFTSSLYGRVRDRERTAINFLVGFCIGFTVIGVGVGVYRGATPFQSGGWTDRQYAIETGLRAWQFRPLTGYGPENFTAAFSRYADPQRLTRPELQFDSAHNHYVDALVETGVIGLAATLVLTGVVAWHLRRDGFMLAAWLGLTVQLFFLFDTPALNLVWAILIGVAISQVKTQEESHERIRETVARTKNRRTPANLHL